MSTLESEVLRIAANAHYANGNYRDASHLYEEASFYSESAKELTNAGIAYYHLGIRSINNKGAYLRKAKKLLEKAVDIENDTDAKYYLALVNIELGSTQLLSSFFDDLIEKKDYLIYTTIESYVSLNEIKTELEAEAFRILEDPFLINIYEFLKQYIIGSNIEERLKEKYKTDNGYTALAKQLVELQKKYIFKKQLKEQIKNPLKRYLILIYVLIRNEEPQKEILEKIKRLDFSDIPPYTKAIMEAFVDYSRIKHEKELPYFIQEDISFIEELDAAKESIENLNKEEIVGLIKKLEIKAKGKTKDFLREIRKNIEEGKLTLGEMTVLIDRAIEIAIIEMNERLKAFFDKSDVRFILKSILSSLKVKPELKFDVFSKL